MDPRIPGEVIPTTVRSKSMKERFASEKNLSLYPASTVRIYTKRITYPEVNFKTPQMKDRRKCLWLWIREIFLIVTSKEQFIKYI